jgi:hypothetical protein
MTAAVRSPAHRSDSTPNAGLERLGALRAAAPYTSEAQNAWMRPHAFFSISSLVA